MADDGMASDNQNRHPARLRTRTSGFNRNNTSFKFSRNSLIINAKPDSNRNTNDCIWVFAARTSRPTNRFLFTTQPSPLTNHTLFLPMSHCYNHLNSRSRHSSPVTSHCLSTAGGPRVANHRSHFNNHESLRTHHTLLPLMSQCCIAKIHPKINRQPRRLETVVSHRKHTSETPINRQLKCTSVFAHFIRRFLTSNFRTV
jgi:hypothetical protein